MAEQHTQNLVDEAAGFGPSAESGLTLGHVLTGIGAEQVPPIRLEDIHLIRHSFKRGDPDALQGPEDLTEQRVFDYTRAQTRRFPTDPGRYWVILTADGHRRSRLYGTFENFGEVISERTATDRYFDLHPSRFLEPLVKRLVVEWGNPRIWHRRATSAANLPILEIADPHRIPFPGFDRVLLKHHKLGEMVDDHRYADWHAALSAVQGIYLITDSCNGKQYVGKADGAERIFQRWMSYARDGHGGNLALRELVKTGHAPHFVFSILRVFGPSTPSSEVDAAESHYKNALMTRTFGLNQN